MSDLPDWLINLLVQYPVATLNGLVAWYAWRQVREKETDLHNRVEEREKRQEARTDELRKDIRGRADKEVERFQAALKESYAAHLTSKDAEIERLTTQLTEEVKKLAKKIDELKKKSD